MACESRARQMALAAGLAGIPATSSRKGFYIALTAGTILGSLLLRRWLTRERKTSLTTAGQAGTVPTLTGRLRLDPIPADKLDNQQCASCRSSAQDKRGLWYAHRGSTYCQDCAPEAARKSGFSLTVPSQKSFTPGSFNPSRTRPVAVKLKPGQIRVGPTQVEGYAVLRASNGQETGLTITPAFKIDSSGQVQVNQKSWFVNYSRVGQPVGGPFKTLREAQGLTSELARLDWNRPIEQFDDFDVRYIVTLARQYREELDFRDYVYTE